MALSTLELQIAVPAVYYTQKTNGSDVLYSKFKNLKKRTKKVINSSYHQYLKSLSGNLQDSLKYFWSFYSVKEKTKRIPETLWRYSIY